MRKGILLIMALCAWPVAAVDLGIVGPTYPIEEQDAIEALIARAKAMEQSGELARVQAEHQRKAIARMEHPKPVDGIRKGSAPTSYYIDPTWTLDRDIRDDKGRLLFARGTRINPLDHTSWNTDLLFLDGSDAEQVKLAIRIMDKARRAVKPVLVAGAPLELMRKIKKRFYFDQGGALSRQLKISAVPALVTQDGKRLRVDVLPTP